MRLVRLIYASTLKKGLDPSELAKIHKTASTKNPEFDITGILAFGNDYFLQCLEGGREAVNRLYFNIINDKRHSHSLLLDYSEINEREFDEWAMKLVLLTPKKLKLMLKFSSESEFNPYHLSGPSALKLLLSLRKND